MNSSDPIIHGENLGGQFSYHVLNTSGPPMIHVTRSFRPEVVLFGQEQTLDAPFVLEAGKSILIKAAAESDKVTISKFVIGQPDQKRVVSLKVDDVIRAAVELGAAYPDVVQALQQAKSRRALASRFEVDALPEADRAYRPKETVANTTETIEGNERIVVASPVPKLFSTRKQQATQ